MLLLWELSSRGGWIVSDYWPPVSHILAAAVAQLAGGEILVSLAATLRRAAMGYVAASVAGITLGIVLARNCALRYGLLPLYFFLEMAGLRTATSLCLVVAVLSR